MKPRPKFRTTLRVRNANNLYDDTTGKRFVIYRRAGGVERKTSVRYDTRSYYECLTTAHRIASRLHFWPAEKLAMFRF